MLLQQLRLLVDETLHVALYCSLSRHQPRVLFNHNQVSVMVSLGSVHVLGVLRGSVHESRRLHEVEVGHHDRLLAAFIHRLLGQPVRLAGAGGLIG